MPGDILERLREEHLREALAAAIRAHDDPPDDVSGVEVLGLVVNQDADVGGAAGRILDPVVAGAGLLVAVVEFGLVDLLLDEESTSIAELEEFIGIPIRFQVETHYTQEQYDVVLL